MNVYFQKVESVIISYGFKINDDIIRVQDDFER